LGCADARLLAKCAQEFIKAPVLELELDEFLGRRLAARLLLGEKEERVAARHGVERTHPGEEL